MSLLDNHKQSNSSGNNVQINNVNDNRNYTTNINWSSSDSNTSDNSNEVLGWSIGSIVLCALSISFYKYFIKFIDQYNFIILIALLFIVVLESLYYFYKNSIENSMKIIIFLINLLPIVGQYLIGQSVSYDHIKMIYSKLGWDKGIESIISSLFKFNNEKIPTIIISIAFSIICFGILFFVMINNLAISLKHKDYGIRFQVFTGLLFIVVYYISRNPNVMLNLFHSTG